MVLRDLTLFTSSDSDMISFYNNANGFKCEITSFALNIDIFEILSRGILKSVNRQIICFLSPKVKGVVHF